MSMMFDVSVSAMCVLEAAAHGSLQMLRLVRECSAAPLIVARHGWIEAQVNLLTLYAMCVLNLQRDS